MDGDGEEVKSGWIGEIVTVADWSGCDCRADRKVEPNKTNIF